jgi:hypothetical protein
VYHWVRRPHLDDESGRRRQPSTMVPSLVDGSGAACPLAGHCLCGCRLRRVRDAYRPSDRHGRAIWRRNEPDPPLDVPTAPLVTAQGEVRATYVSDRAASRARSRSRPGSTAPGAPRRPTSHGAPAGRPGAPTRRARCGATQPSRPRERHPVTDTAHSGDANAASCQARSVRQPAFGGTRRAPSMTRVTGHRSLSAWPVQIAESGALVRASTWRVSSRCTRRYRTGSVAVCGAGPTGYTFVDRSARMLARRRAAGSGQEGPLAEVYAQVTSRSCSAPPAIRPCVSESAVWLG